MSGKGNWSSASSVDPSRRDFRAMMYYDYCQRKSFQECFQSSKHYFGHQSLSEATIFRWFRQLMSGARMLEDDDHCSRVAMTVNPEDIPRVEFLIKKDPKMTYAKIQDITKISSGSLTRILHDSLGERKCCTCWMPITWMEQKWGRGDWWTHMPRKFDRGRSPCVWGIATGDETWVYQYNPETKQQSVVWDFPDENPPVKFKRKRSVSKQMIACFFAKFGHVATIPLEDRKTVTADWYVNHCLPKIFQAWCKWHPQIGVCGLLLHHDNASTHTAAVTLDFLATSDVQLVTQTPYSPDLAPCDWFLFPFVKRQLKVFVPFCQKIVSEHQRCPSILWGHHFGHTLVNVIGCHRQLVWEDGQMCTGWGGFLRKVGVDRVVVGVVEKPDCKT